MLSRHNIGRVCSLQTFDIRHIRVGQSLWMAVDSCAYKTVGRICSRQITGTYHTHVGRGVIDDKERLFLEAEKENRADRLKPLNQLTIVRSLRDRKTDFSS